MTLAHTGARELAYTILALEQQKHDGNWLKCQYDHNQRSRVKKHIRFADYWYAANGQFTDLQEHSREIARDSGLNLSPEKAFQLLAQGGFTNDILGQAVIAGFDLGSMKQVMQRFSKEEVPWLLSAYNVFQLDLGSADVEFVAVYNAGEINRIKCYVKNGQRLPVTGLYSLLIDILSRTEYIEQIYRQLVLVFRERFSVQHARVAIHQALGCLEVMVSSGIVKAILNPELSKLNISIPIR